MKSNENLCIETTGLSFSFSGTEAILKNINLQVPNASIFGFLGPNGAGKTTTLKLILGLLKLQQGSIKVFGKSFDSSRIEILRNVGSLIEAPSFYSHLNARENLILLQKIYQCPIERIDEVLAVVGLSKTAKKKVGKFSFGMKQRLGIAIALLHNPTLLILDEPTNGLDPNGIIEVRELLKKLHTEHKITILISSHLLSEIEKLVTHIGIIHQGNLLFQGTLDQLHLKQKQFSMVMFETNNCEKAIEIFKAKNIDAKINANLIEAPFISKEMNAELNHLLVENGIDVSQIAIQQNDLESIFMELTSNE